MNQPSIKAFAGSNSSQSINAALVRYTLRQLDGFQVDFLDLNDFEMPIYGFDREKSGGIPELAHRFRGEMAAADAIVCSLAEHNRSYSVAFKNILDWSSRVDMNIFAGKPMFLMSTSPGGFGGGNVMAAAKSFFPKCGADVLETFSLPSFGKNFGPEGILDETLRNEHLEALARFSQQVKEVYTTSKNS